MTKKDIQSKAKDLGVKGYTKLDTQELIRSIQSAEGNSPCFQSEIAPVCGLENCLWRSDCISA